MRAHSDNRSKVQRIADLKIETEELERKLDSVRMSLESELAEPARQTAAGQVKDARSRARRVPGRYHHGDDSAVFCGPVSGRRPALDGAGLDGADLDGADVDGADLDRADLDDPELDDADISGSGLDFDDAEFGLSDERTEVLVTHGRHSTYRRGLRHRRAVLIIAAAVAVAIGITVMAVILSGGGASWPASVATVQAEAARACQNPDVRSEPDQINFACAPATRQVLWVFALMSSDDNPDFSDPVTGREGLEPITATEGGQVAWSLNLHHPYNPLNPVDSLAVAARAINSIVGGATVTAANGTPVVQGGLEADPANCVRYTGSAAVTSRQGFPGVCARPIISPAGQAALVADVYQKWIVGATPQAAQDAAVLYENASNPGDARVQLILRHLRQFAA